MKQHKLFLVLLLVSILFTSIGSVKAEHWVEVVKYEGKSAAFTTEPFTCNYSEWRIRYATNVTGHVQLFPYEWYFINITTYPQGDNSNFVDKIYSPPTQGKYLYNVIHNRTGTFYMNIITGYSDNYSIIVEQDIDSIPVTTSPSSSPTPTASNLEDVSASPLSLSPELLAIATVIAIAVVAAGVLVWRKTRR